MDLCGNAATYVGIAQVAAVAQGAFIVSDSFAPCVPVVAFGRNTCSLAHCNGIGGIDGYSADWDKAAASIIVVSKERESRQSQIAGLIFEKLTSKGFKSLSICELPTSNTIGIIVRGDTILMYWQEI